VSDPAELLVAHDGADLLDLTAALVAVPSVSGDEQALADAVEARLRERAPRLEVDRLGRNVVVRTGNGAVRRVVLAGHLDTVPANGNAAPRIEGDSLWGLGASDMKSGVAVMLRLAEEVARKKCRHELTFVFYEGEELADERNGLHRLFARRSDLVMGDLAVLLEPTGGWAEVGCQGTITLKATLQGRRAHTARPWMGSNAIHRAAPLLGRLAAYEARTVEVEGLEFRESLQVVRIEGGVANNVVPDRCSVTVNRRFAPSRALDAAVAETRALLEGADEIEVLNASPAAAPGLAEPLVTEMLDALDLTVRPKLGWTDVARFAAHGIPAVNFGPGDPQVAHTANERVERSAVEGCYTRLARFLGIDRG